MGLKALVPTLSGLGVGRVLLTQAFDPPSDGDASVWVSRVKWLRFHEYRGRRQVSICVFINIVAATLRDIFSTCVFINIARLAIIFLFPLRSRRP